MIIEHEAWVYYGMQGKLFPSQPYSTEPKAYFRCQALGDCHNAIVEDAVRQFKARYPYEKVRWVDVLEHRPVPV